jgi:hypothetical protein
MAIVAQSTSPQLVAVLALPNRRRRCCIEASAA